MQESFFFTACICHETKKLIIYTTLMETSGKALEQHTSSSKMTEPINSICNPLTGLENCMESHYIKKYHCNTF